VFGNVTKLQIYINESSTEILKYNVDHQNHEKQSINAYIYGTQSVMFRFSEKQSRNVGGT
jgi:hypothetical protein